MLIKEITVFVLFLAIFFGGIYYTHIYETDRIDEIVLQDNLEIIEEETFYVEITHDGDSSTNYYELKLDATNSVDLDGDEITYFWKQTSGDTLAIPNPTEKILYLKTTPGEYGFRLEVTDSYGSKGIFNKRVVVSKEPNLQPDPIAEIGTILDQEIFMGTIKHDGKPETNEYNIKLDAGKSKDLDSDKIEYLWTQISGKTLVISDDKSPVVYLKAEPGEYSFKLDITDAYGITSSYTQAVAIAAEPNSPPEATFLISNEAKPINYPKGPKWQTDPEKVTAFQTENGLEVDGAWGPASQGKYLEIEADKNTKANEKDAEEKAEEKAAEEKAAKKAAEEKAAQVAAMKIYTDELAKIEAEIRNVSGFGAAGKRRTLEAKKEAHIKTKPK